MRKAIYAALEALSGAVPAGLGAIVWLGAKLGAELIPALVLAMLCGLALTNFCGARSQRPQVFLARFFEISLLAGFVDSFVPQLGAWGLADTPQVRLSLVMAACLGAALLQPVFYGLRLQGLTRFIPAPVFAGFMNAVALLLVISPIKDIHDGRAWRSNCVRSLPDAQHLERQGGRIQCVRLQGALYVGVARSLRAELATRLRSLHGLITRERV